MPAHLVARIDLDLIYPPFLEKYLAAIAAAKERGAYYEAVSGFRSPAEQAQKYAQGRTAPGPIITNAGPWSSAHNFGLAIDSARDGDLVRVGLQPVWDRPEAYVILHDLGEAQGIQVGVPGVPGGDPGHAQWRLSYPGRRESAVLKVLRGAVIGLPEDMPLAERLQVAWKALEGIPVPV